MTTVTSQSTSEPRQFATSDSRADQAEAHWPVVLKLPQSVVVGGSDACADWFWDLCLANDETAWQMELNPNGELEIMPPTDEPSDVHENRTSSKVYLWDEEQGFPGVPTGPTAAYRLPNGSLRVPDAAWTAISNVRARDDGEPRGRPYCPDFVVEIRSTSQRSLSPLLDKMQEYMDNGAKLGWLIDPLERTVRIYRAGMAEPELLDDAETLDGEDALPGFVFAVRELIFELV